MEMDVWTSPDFTLTIKVGTEEDHALLMASLFRTCKYEDMTEFKEWRNDMKKTMKTKKLKEKKRLFDYKLPKVATLFDDSDEEEEEKEEGAGIDLKGGLNVVKMLKETA